jgi:hypothetical protein
MSPVYKALLIGNSEFTDDPHNLPPLKGPVNDPALLLDALTDRELGLFDPTDVRLLPERSKRDIATAMEQSSLTQATTTSCCSTTAATASKTSMTTSICAPATRSPPRWLQPPSATARSTP